MNRCVASAISAALLALTLPASPGKPTRGHDIVDTAVAAGFDTLASALKAADLVDGLRGDGPFTVFAPTDEAFARLPKKTLRALLQPENRDQLRAILTYHVVSGRVSAADVVQLRFATTLNGQRAAIDVRDGGVRIGGARVVKTDVEASNGIIHVIDTVLLPETVSIVAKARAAGMFDTLLRAGQAAGLANALDGGPFTVLAPTDAAFAKIPQATLASLLEERNRSQLAAILKYHVIPGRVFSDQAVAAGKGKTLQGQKVTFAINDGRLQVNGANVIDNDLQASNGVIHVIDSVLMPDSPKPKGRKLLGLTYEHPSAALAAQLGLDRQRALVVTGLTANANAKAAGLERFDVIVAVAGLPATDRNLTRAKEERDYGEPVELQVLRRGERRTISVPIGAAEH